VLRIGAGEAVFNMSTRIEMSVRFVQLRDRVFIQLCRLLRGNESNEICRFQFGHNVIAIIVLVVSCRVESVGDILRTATQARINYMKTLLYIHLEESPVPYYSK